MSHTYHLLWELLPSAEVRVCLLHWLVHLLQVQRHQCEGETTRGEQADTLRFEAADGQLDLLARGTSYEERLHMCPPIPANTIRAQPRCTSSKHHHPAAEEAALLRMSSP